MENKFRCKRAFYRSRIFMTQLTTDRPYRMALSSEEALQILDYEAMRGWLDGPLASKFSAISPSE